MKPNGILVVDDERIFADEHFDDAVYAPNAIVALGILANEWVEQGKNQDRYLSELWLDHDLGDIQVDSKIIVQFLSDLSATKWKLRVDNIYVHTMNSVGGEYLVDTLERANYNVKKVSLPILKKTSDRPCDNCGGTDNVVYIPDPECNGVHAWYACIKCRTI